MKDFDLMEIIESSYDDGYEHIKNRLGGSEFDLDFKEMLDVGEVLWETNKKCLLIKFEDNGNLFDITVIDFDGETYDGHTCTCNRDATGIAYAVKDALREYIRLNNL